MAINLIPPKLKTERKIKLYLVGFYLISCCILAFSLVVSLVFFIAGRSLLADIKEYDQKIEDGYQALLRYDDIEKMIRRSNQKLETIKKLDGSKIYWSEILNEISDSTPPETQIQSVALGKDVRKISISGLAKTRKDIADMKEEMENSPIFKNVTFSSSSYNNSAQDYTFILNAELEKI